MFERIITLQCILLQKRIPTQLSSLQASPDFLPFPILFLTFQFSPVFRAHLLKLQPKRRHLEGPQLDFRLAMRPRDFIAVVFQQIASGQLLHGQRALQDASRFPAQALVDAHDDAVAVPLRQLPSRDIGVVFAALDAVEDQGRRTGQGDAAQERSGGGGDRGAGGRGKDAEGVVEVVGGTDGP